MNVAQTLQQIKEAKEWSLDVKTHQYINIDAIDIKKDRDEFDQFITRIIERNPQIRKHIYNRAAEYRITKVMPGLYIGSVDAAKNPKLLKKHGIRYVLNVCEEKVHHSPSDIVYLHASIDESCQNPTNVYEGCARFIEEALTTHKKILVHCAAGVNRSPSVVAYYLIKRFHFPPSKVVKYLYGQRNVVCPMVYSQAKLYDLFSSIVDDAGRNSIIKASAFEFIAK
jgi:protein-tyrosine phosphatase